MRLLITGSSGQIGTNLALRALAEGHQVWGLDSRPNGWCADIPTIRHDLREQHRPLREVLAEPLAQGRLDCVVHLAAHAKVHELVLQPERALENIATLFPVLEFCREQQLPLVFGSSREVYADIQRTIATHQTREEQADFAFTASPYSASKIAGEALIYSYAHCYDLPYLVFRFSNVYGRYDNDLERMERVIPLFIDLIRRDQEVTVFGEDKILDFTYVDDCVSGVLSGIEGLVRGQLRDHTINLAYGAGNSLVQMAQYIAEALGKPLRMRILSSQRGEVTHYVADIARAHELLGYAPEVPLAEGIRRTVAWVVEWGERQRS
ncbi:MAG: NAD(P)-dependent oxidoreductase [Chloroflexi bacterium]|nr:NAD(P)-dependent oxidoreductase [Chloroflexota bacterium]